ncbi:MAG TPA: hypothetical protein VK050_06270 [Flavobacteriaceae bacterium]|nr:hypothetical protein [Flavobacteriaceae bacterium]
MSKKAVQNFAKNYDVSDEEAKRIVKVLSYLPHSYRARVAKKSNETKNVVVNVRLGRTRNYKVLEELLALAEEHYNSAKRVFPHRKSINKFQIKS